MKKPTFFSCFIFLFYSACTNKTDQYTVASLQGSIENSNTFIRQNTEFVLKSLESKTTDPATKEKAEYWLHKANEAKKLAKEMNNYIEILRKEKTINFSKSDELLNKLSKYDRKITSIDSLIQNKFSISIEAESEESRQKHGKRFYKDNFKNADAVHTSAILSRMDNYIRLRENQIITFCNEQIAIHDIIDYFPEALVSQNSYFFNAGQEIEIKAGVGSFARLNNESIVINGIPVVIGEGGIAIFKINAPHKPGKYNIPVKLKFIDQDGRGQELTHYVSYTVAKPCDQ
ncbi:MAG TPA: hypothetical protein VK483_15185 [Chitinophagaceae bacterium]|nr:hypothetical protein [Chitinophagaceae bacterium]